MSSMYVTVALWLLLLAWPAIAVIVDGAAGIRAHGLRYTFGTATQEDFRVLVPIWGSVKYLVNADALSRYGSRVTLVTTGDETPEFYRQLHQVAMEHDFVIWHDTPTPARGSGAQRRRDTSRPVRDRLIRNVLKTVTEPYVIPLDADSFPSGDLALLVGELEHRELDIASVRIMPGNPKESVLTRLQQFEYWLAMQLRFIAPWLVSGACQVARTAVLADVMAQHSLFFQGNDVEIGLLAEARGHRIGHIAFEISSDVPARFRPWVRQRLAWAGGTFRLFIVNIRFAWRHPFLWFYGAGVATVGLAFRWQVFTEPPRPLLWAAMAGYGALVLYLYLRRGGGNGWVLVMPFYILLSSLVILPLGPIWYVKMSLAHRNWGVIRPYRDGCRVKVAKPVRFAVRRAPRTKVAGALASILIVVVGLGAIVTGGFIRPAPTGLVTGASAQVYGHNLIRDGNFTAPGRSNKEDRGVIQQRGGIAGDWYDESANSAGLPVYHQQGGTETLTYAANPGNVRTHFTRKVKIFQPVVPARAGQVYRFQITIQRCRVGNTFVRKNPNYPAPAYPVVGIEWFSGVRLVRDRYLGEQDVYPPISSRSETVAVTSPPLPAGATFATVYIQFPEVNPSTSIDVTISNASLVLVGGPR